MLDSEQKRGEKNLYERVVYLTFFLSYSHESYKVSKHTIEYSRHSF